MLACKQNYVPENQGHFRTACSHVHCTIFSLYLMTCISKLLLCSISKSKISYLKILEYLIVADQVLEECVSPT